MFKNKLKRDKLKRIVAVLMFLCVILSFTGCGHEAEGTTEEVIIIEDLTSMAEGVMSYEQIQAAEEGAPVVVDVSVKEKSQWEDYKAVLMVSDSDGIYTIKSMTCSEEVYEELSIGTKIRITGYKGTSSDNLLITDASFEILE